MQSWNLNRNRFGCFLPFEYFFFLFFFFAYVILAHLGHNFDINSARLALIGFDFEWGVWPWTYFIVLHVFYIFLPIFCFFFLYFFCNALNEN